MVSFAASGDHRIKIKNAKIETSTWNWPGNQDGNGDTNFNWLFWGSSQKFGKGAGRVGNQRKNHDYPDFSIVVIGQNTKKSLGNLRKLAVTETPVEDHQLKLARNT